MLASKGDTGSSGSSDFTARNETGSTIEAFKVVYISGASGNKPLISKASASSESTSSKTIGLTIASIANNSDGLITQVGELIGLDTSAYADGNTLWLSTTAGELTNVRPTQPNHSVFIGYVTRSHPTLGSILVNIQNGFELDELHDVLITSPSVNQALVYDGSLWKNKTTRYIHSQASASATWTVNHNLGYNPTCVVVTSGGLQIEPEILHTSTNQTIIYMNTSISGTARFT